MQKQSGMTRVHTAKRKYLEFLEYIVHGFTTRSHPHFAWKPSAIRIDCFLLVRQEWSSQDKLVKSSGLDWLGNFQMTPNR